ncbi:MATE family efflux transporter [Garciella nitratireducens]|uniref:MATE family efflux transporter n=1 Tax=Garciella nitratireducens TaxID=218205 RepID=UPI000DE84FC1|nr:MATE family efflux transporter [Garciella nitratireducens]RBP44933.1 putative MATE family efflux protein [Garciella nitratireducens]
MSKNQRSERLGTEKISTLLYQLSLPSTFAMLVNALYNIIDTIFVGFIGEKAIAALSIVFPIQNILAAVAVGTGVGASSYISRSLGANNKEEANRTISQSLTLFILLSMIMIPLILLYLDPILTIFGASPAILSLAKEYAGIIIFGSFTTFFNMIFNNIIRGEGNAKVPMNSMLIGAIGNIILDPIFIFGLDMGVKGAALATILANGISNIYLIVFLASDRIELKIKKDYLRPNFKIIKEIYSVGSTNILMNSANSIVIGFINNQLTPFGDKAIAALGIMLKINTLVFMPCFGLNQGLLPIIGYNYGARKKVRVSEAIWTGIKYSTVFMILGWILFTFFPEPLSYIFTRDSELIDLTVDAFRYNAIAFPLIGSQIILSGFFQGVGKALPALLSSLLRQLGFLIPAAYILPKYFGVIGVWLAYPVSDFLSIFLTYIFAIYVFRVLDIPIYYKKIEKKQNKETKNRES